MTPPTTHAAGAARCTVCGQELPPNVPPARCPQCLLQQGLRTMPASQGDVLAVPESKLHRVLPRPGEVFGHYRIGRQLGAGGMGAVFEAEDMDSGRRVALKVLGHRLDSPVARSRFLREGRLAASVNHPNSVYVFGTEDIAGVPVIAMELVAGGTLHDRVVSQGPLPVGEVVSCGLQIIAGLEAAQQIGILHRDIKPSNCFVEANGKVKIGDFGLSISAFLRSEPTLTATGAFLGTPTFSAPEHLRGDELTVRSDIYSVGVTLYFLLTGRHPFEAPDLVRLLATVLERRADSPAKWRPELPAALCRVVLRCLEKDPEKRFRNYDELRDALLPYAATAPTPATLGLRLAAYILDALVLAVPVGVVDVLVNLWLPRTEEAGPLRLAEAIMSQLTPRDAPQHLLHNVCGMVLALIYYSLLEGLGGASVGKRLCGLVVARVDHTVVGVPRAFLRAMVVTATPTVVWLLAWKATQPWATGSVEPWLAALGLLLLPTRLLFFVTARQRNGFAGVHDLLSATRVIRKSAWRARPAAAQAWEAPPATSALSLVGPYHVLDRMDHQDGSELLLGFDERLVRRVWIRRLPPGTPSIPPPLRLLARPGRLRWLTARRTQTEAWDAYEAVSGNALLAVIAQPQEWSRVRYWLLDLAEELVAATDDGTLPARLSLDRVWITADGHAKLLDFAAPGTLDGRPEEPAQVEPVASTPQAFLSAVAASALGGRTSETRNVSRAAALPLPLHASRVLETLTSGADLKQCLAALRPVLNLPSRVSRARRTLMLAAALALPLVLAVLAGGMLALRRSVLHAAPELATLHECLAHHHELRNQVKSGQGTHLADLEAFETYIAGQFATIITNAARWNNPITRVAITEPFRTEAVQILARSGPPSPMQLADASARVEAFFRKAPEVAAREAVQEPNPLFAALVFGYGWTVAIVIFPCLLASLFSRGGALVRLFDVVLVTRNGLPASRWRVTARNLVAWSPLLLLPTTGWINGLWPFAGGVCLVLAAVTSLLLPNRGLADRLAGTWLVPR